MRYMLKVARTFLQTELTWESSIIVTMLFAKRNFISANPMVVKPAAMHVIHISTTSPFPSQVNLGATTPDSSSHRFTKITTQP
jgi:hypothetical protein